MPSSSVSRRTFEALNDPGAQGTPERWSLSAGDVAQATLRIPADALRERRFEIACAMTVAVPDEVLPRADGKGWHQMTVHVDGQQQWQRRVATHNPGAFDGLEFRLRRSVPVGRELRVTVAVSCQGSRRRSLVIEADEG